MSTYKFERIVTEKVEIKPCPFCGSDNTEVYQQTGDWGYSSSKAYVECRRCGAKGPLVEDGNYSLSSEQQIRLAISKWNDRE